MAQHRARGARQIQEQILLPLTSDSSPNATVARNGGGWDKIYFHYFLLLKPSATRAKRDRGGKKRGRKITEEKKSSSIAGKK